MIVWRAAFEDVVVERDEHCLLVYLADLREHERPVGCVGAGVAVVGEVVAARVEDGDGSLDAVVRLLPACLVVAAVEERRSVHEQYSALECESRAGCHASVVVRALPPSVCGVGCEIFCRHVEVLAHEVDTLFR